LGAVVNADDEAMRPSRALAQQIGYEVERALEAQPPRVRLALKQALAEHGATLRWEPDARRPQRVVILIAGNELLEITLARSALN
jgi:hypothetical protein